MIYRIPLGKHYARPWRFAIWWNRQQFGWKVIFTDSCRYDLQNDDQLDTNKLCGVGYFPGFHHKDSARFGWRYNTATGLIELLAYCYVSKERIIKPIATCEIGKVYELELHTGDNLYSLSVWDPEGERFAGYVSVKYSHMKKLQYGLWPYFGGNQEAPREIKIQLDKL
jgi:hypothetical protein